MTTPGPDQDTLRTAIALATCAPSVHNTQPWRWSIGPGSLHLYADRDRLLAATDPDGRDLIVSCGAALHHLRVALAALGWRTVVRRVPDPTEPDHLAAVEFHEHVPSDHEVSLTAMISRRRTDRRRMSSWPVPPDHLELLAGLARHEGALCFPIIEPGARFHLAGAIAQAAVVQAADPGYAAEMALWTGRGNSTRDGVLAASVPTAFQANSDTRTFPHGTLTQPAGKQYGQQTEYLAIATSSDDLLSRLRAGEATSAVLLGATELGLATCTLSQPLEIADTRRMIRDDLLDGTAVPQLIIRVGWAPTSAAPLPHTPRRDVDDIIEHIAG
ncbi:Acg family FMN-binding oxidoreductase [Actinophytocola sp.]|uniref:Acg family FMN-binding oxidoreductase n=1 Tax=Actinophytocola sp. TaxID=1872138 RepID=UPI00389ADBA9